MVYYSWMMNIFFQNLFSLFSHLSLTFFYVYKYDNDVDDGDNEKIFSAMMMMRWCDDDNDEDNCDDNDDLYIIIGRAGRTGESVTFFTENDIPNLRSIANVMKLSGCDVPDWMLSIKPVCILYLSYLLFMFLSS